MFAVTLPEKPGAYKKFLSLIGNRNVTEFNYRYHTDKEAHVYVGVQVADRKESLKLLESLQKHGYPTLDLTEGRDGEEPCPPHGRRACAGGLRKGMKELIYRFEFPERPGALMNFLTQMSAGWNISLFHYRNHGADYGRVLVGMQVPQVTWARSRLPQEPRLRPLGRKRQPGIQNSSSAERRGRGRPGIGRFSG